MIGDEPLVSAADRRGAFPDPGAESEGLGARGLSWGLSGLLHHALDIRLRRVVLAMMAFNSNSTGSFVPGATATAVGAEGRIPVASATRLLAAAGRFVANNKVRAAVSASLMGNTRLDKPRDAKVRHGNSH